MTPMRTRRSWKNQDRLWKALGGQLPIIQPVAPTPRCFDCASYPPAGRSTGHCALHGVMVRGNTENRPCFMPRARKANHA
jgi:hypothetical protein